MKILEGILWVVLIVATLVFGSFWVPVDMVENAMTMEDANATTGYLLN